MNVQHPSSRSCFSVKSIMLVIALALSACAGGTTPVAQNPMATLVVQPDPAKVVMGQPVSLIVMLHPPQEITEADWEILSGNGVIRKEKPDIVFFTPTEVGDTGLIVVVVKGKTANGASFQQQVTLKVILPTETPGQPTGAPTPTLADTPTPQMTDTPRPTEAEAPDVTETPAERQACDNFTAAAIVIRPLDFPMSERAGRITSPAHCQTGLQAGSPISVGGTVEDLPAGEYLWLFAYTLNGRYYPQCNNAKEGKCGANYARGRWAVTTYLGRKGCKEHFHLVLASVNEAGNQFLIDSVIAQAKANFFPGFAKEDLLPYDVREIDSIEVETAGETCP